MARNIKNAVGASSKCRNAISYLREIGRFEALPEELRETAELREQHPEATLSELAFLHNPTITKSGLNHRLQKIMDFAAAQAVAKEKNADSGKG